MRARALAIVALLSVAAASALAQGGQDPPVTDPEGDARWYGTSDAYYAARDACTDASDVTARACTQVPVEPPQAAQTPAPPVLDLVSADVRADADNITVVLSLASVDDAFTGTGFPSEFLGYTVCWTVGEMLCRDGVALAVHRFDGILGYDAWAFHFDGPCAKIGSCPMNVGFDVVPGSPGRLEWTIPRAFFAPTSTIVDPMAYAYQATSAPGAPVVQYAAEGEVRARGYVATEAFSYADVAGPGRTVELPPARPVPGVPAGATFQPDEEEGAPRGRTDLDILAVELVETERTLTVATQLARVDELPEDHHYMVTVGAGGSSLVAGYTATGGARGEYSGICDGECAPNPPQQLTKPATVDVEAGEPGWVNVTFSRIDLADPYRGDPLAFLYVGFLLPEAITEEGEGPLQAARTSRFLGDYFWDPPAWRFTLGDDRPAEDERAVVLEDPAFDLQVPTELAAGGDLASFDITSLALVGAEPGLTRMELGIRDLSTVKVPEGYSAVFYVIGVQVEEGSFMAGYYLGAGGTGGVGGAGLRDFFCMSDTAVFAQPPSDPASQAWTQIQGLLSIARGRGQGGGGGAAQGDMVLFVPHTCFDQPAAGGDIPAEAIAAGTYAIPQGGRDIVMLDAVASEGPVLIAAAQAPAVERPFYAAPFGIDNFWDITGVASAILVSLIGLVAIQRKRGALRRYLQEMEDILREHAGDARMREKRLLDLQARLKADLLRNRITESHFVIVERRLESYLGKVRVQALAEAFGDLPHRLLLRLQELLFDGAMDREDWKLFASQVDAEPHLTPESRAAINRRVEAWVREHAAATRPGEPAR